VSDARLRLGEIEHAMRRLDDRSYGRCFSCLRLLPFSDLICEPETRHCAGCRRTGPTAGVPAIADAG
jgi:RNA polymerase-binding transcription factor DksA